MRAYVNAETQNYYSSKMRGATLITTVTRKGAAKFLQPFDSVSLYLVVVSGSGNKTTTKKKHPYLG